MIAVMATAWAQNPKQRQKYVEKAKKAARNAKHEPYQYVPSVKDSDGDGVEDFTDKCPHTPHGEKVTPFGCPFDTDFDGLYDTEDGCPTEAGPKENNGCPWLDSDKDGVTDNADKCPQVPGLPKFGGCPDKDLDGIPDFEDRCVDVKGTKKYEGCPPPDSDGDGVNDELDLCKSTPGVASNRGCPELKPAEKAALQKAFDNLLFETGKDVIMQSSFNSLNALGDVMSKNKVYILHLEGHTDDVGDDDANLDLSKRRAASVKAYLVRYGIKESRIFSEGYGESRPKSENTSDEGRKQNRRVEMVLAPQ